jgi:hypothetical protein
MSRARILVYTKPVSADQIENFENWYDTVHIPEILEKIDEIKFAERFVTPSGQDYASLAVYIVEAGDPAKVLSTVLDYAERGEFRMHPSLSPERNVVLLHELGG